MSNKLLINHKYIEIQCNRNDWETHNLVSQIPYVHANRIKTIFRTSARNIKQVLKLFRNVDERNVHTLPPFIKEVWDAEERRLSETARLLEDGPQRPRGWLYAHQQLGRELAEIHDRYAFFYDTRTRQDPNEPTNHC